MFHWSENGRPMIATLQCSGKTFLSFGGSAMLEDQGLFEYFSLGIYDRF